tara:strand:+ start:1150 stop:1470 length:321 start_codon:yes stop_codon:yes gene_type:complete
MSDYSDNAIKALISTIEATNDTVKELTRSVQALVTSENQRIVKDEHQQEINIEQKKINAKNMELWDDARDTIVRAERFHKAFDSVTVKVSGLIVIAILGLIGFKFI